MVEKITVGLNCFSGTALPSSLAPLVSIEASGAFAAWDGVPPENVLEDYTVEVVEDGFDATGTATTFSETINLGVRVRRAWPNDASLDASRTSLGKRIYVNAVVNGGAVTNNSTLASPSPFYHWTQMNNQVVGNTHTPRGYAAHIRGVACVKWIYTDNGSGYAESIATSISCTVNPNSGKAVMEYVGTPVDLTSFNLGRLNVRAIVYPRIGTTVYDSDTFSGEIHNHGTHTHRRSPQRVANPPIAYIDATSGNDATGIVSTNDAVARANPFQRFGWNSSPFGAVTRMREFNNNAANYPGDTINALDGGIFRLVNGTGITAPSVNQTQLIGSFRVEKHPDTIGRQTITANQIFMRLAGSFIFANWNCVVLSGFNFVLNANNSLFSNAARTLYYLEDCSLNLSASTSAGTIGGTSFGSAAFLINCTITGSPVFPSYLTGTNGMLVGAIGCNSTVQLNNTVFNTACFHGNHFIGGRYGSSATYPHPFILINTEVQRSIETITHTFIPGYVNIRGVCIINLSAEECASVSRPFIRIAGDGHAANSNHILLWHWSIAGVDHNARLNVGYNDVRTGGPSGTGPNNQTNNWSSIGVVSQATKTIKTETFAPNDGSQTGNWSWLYGADCQGNFTGQWPDTNENQLYQGPRSVQALFGSPIDPLFVDNQASFDESGVLTPGGTDYTLQSGSLARNIVLNSPVPFDQLGNARGAGLSHAGAIQL